MSARRSRKRSERTHIDSRVKLGLAAFLVLLGVVLVRWNLADFDASTRPAEVPRLSSRAGVITDGVYSPSDTLRVSLSVFEEPETTITTYKVAACGASDATRLVLFLQAAARIQPLTLETGSLLNGVGRGPLRPVGSADDVDFYEVTVSSTPCKGELDACDLRPYLASTDTAAGLEGIQVEPLSVRLGSRGSVAFPDLNSSIEDIVTSQWATATKMNAFHVPSQSSCATSGPLDLSLSIEHASPTITSANGWVEWSSSDFLRASYAWSSPIAQAGETRSLVRTGVLLGVGASLIIEGIVLALGVLFTRLGDAMAARRSI